jgi:type IV pilus assembly protein PilY1
LNQVYVGMFRPDDAGLPRWFGNLKQYKLGVIDNELKALDADGAELIDTTEAGEGFIQGCARSFWTPESESSPYYWNYDGFDPVENCNGEPAASNTPDGPIVEKGGQAYRLRRNATATARVVWTCDATCSNLVSFNSSNVSASALDANDPTEQLELINWAKGLDVDDEDGDTITTAEMRPSTHGDIVHSQPVAIDYNSDPTDPAVVVFYGGNDGMLRAINGNQTGTHDGVAAGDEFWSFMPPEFYGSINRLRKNTERVKFPATGPTAGEGVAGSLKSYGMDGPLTAYQVDSDPDVEGIDQRTIFAGMRRAGRSVYAFDVTDIDNPDIKWKVGCPNLDNDMGCTIDDGDVNLINDWDDVGQTWSRISVTLAAGHTDVSGNMTPLLLMGGGYDDCEDVDTGNAVSPTGNNDCSSTKGNLVYLLDGDTGEVLNLWPTERAVPGKVTVVPVGDQDNRILFAYAVDMGGNVYRISGEDPSGDPIAVGSEAPADWIMTKIADLGCSTTVDCNPNRKFLFGPDVVRIPTTDFLGILVGSGDREKPLKDYSATHGVQNYFYSLVDQPANGAWLDDQTGNCQGKSVICMNSLATLAPDPNSLPGDVEGVTPTNKGWKLALRPGEQVVTGSITVDNDVNFSTHIPAEPGQCDTGDYGTATAFSVDYADAGGTATQFIGGGLVPTPVAGKVLIDGVKVPFCIGCGGEGSAIGVKKVGGGINWTQPRSRVYWNVDKVVD